jgi:PAS domain S-box-containing protein
MNETRMDPRREERYRAFVQTSSEGIWLCELEQPVATDLDEGAQIDAFYRYASLTECNDAFARMYGLTRAEEILGARLGDLLIREDPNNDANLRAFIRSGYRQENTESAERDKDGNPKFFANSLVGIVEDGKLLRVWGTQRDVTEQRRYEEDLQAGQRRLRASEERYRSLVNATSDIVWDTKAEGEFVTPQLEWSAFTGQTFDELKGWGWLNAVHPDDQANTARVWSEAVRTGTLYQVEHRLCRRDGVYRHMSVRAVPVREEDGSIREWIGIHRDITAQHENEAAREAALAQLEAVLNGVTDGIIVGDLAGNILMMNPACLKIHGYQSSSEMPARTEDFTAMFSLTQADGQPVPDEERPLARVLRGDVFTDYEVRVTRRDTGAEWWESISGNPVRDKSGKVILVVVTMRDITARRQMEEQRDALLRKIKEGANRQRRFIREILSSVTDGRLLLRDKAAELPAPLTAKPRFDPVLLTRPTLRTFRHQVQDCCQEAGIPQDRWYDLITAVGEAGMNAVIHARGGVGSVYADSARGMVQVWVRDSGQGISEEALHRAILEKGFSSAGTLGHGFWMMLKTADRIYLLTGPKGTTVVLEQGRTPPEPDWMQRPAFSL